MQAVSTELRDWIARVVVLHDRMVKGTASQAERREYARMKPPDLQSDEEMLLFMQAFESIGIPVTVRGTKH